MENQRHTHQDDELGFVVTLVDQDSVVLRVDLEVFPVLSWSDYRRKLFRDNQKPGSRTATNRDMLWRSDPALS